MSSLSLAQNQARSKDLLKPGETPALGNKLPTMVLKTVDVQTISGAVSVLVEGERYEFSEELVKSNPVFGLCLRLAVFNIRDGRVFDPRGSLFGRDRLMTLIGYRLSNRAKNGLASLMRHQWVFLEDCWRANMMTVLINRFFNPTRVDTELINSIRCYKLWFIEFAFSRRKRLRTRRGLKKGWDYPNFSLIGKGLKTLSAWIGYLIVHRDGIKENHPPKEVPFWKGWDGIHRVPTFPWFSGHLSMFREPFTVEVPQAIEWSFAFQAHTFGRALPTPPQQVINETCLKTFDLLTKSFPLEEGVADTLRCHAERCQLDINPDLFLPRNTHTSISGSGEYFSSRKDGGNAAVARAYLGLFNTRELLIRFDGESSPDTMDYDDLIDWDGEELRFFDFLGREFVNSLGLKNLMERRPLKQVFFVDLISTISWCLNIAVDDRDFELPNVEGLITLAASGCMSEFFTFEPKPDGFIHLENEDLEVDIPFWSSSYSISIRQNRSYPYYFMGLAEPGFKVRPLTKALWWVTYLLRMVRFWFEPIFHMDRRAKIGLASVNKVWDLVKILRKESTKLRDEFGTCVLRSMDYSQATDTFPLTMIESIWEGFTLPLRSKYPRHPVWVLYPLIFAERRLVFGKKDLPILRGSLMGEPTSFLTLTLYNMVVLSILEDCIINHRLGGGLTLYTGRICHPNERVDIPAAICGDDVVLRIYGLWANWALSQITQRTGQQLSPGKDFSSKGKNALAGVFCEDHFIIGRDGSVHYFDVIKHRLLTTMAREHTEARAAILGKGQTIERQLSYFPPELSGMVKLSRFVFREVFDRCYAYQTSRIRLPMHFPVGLGGLGLPYDPVDIPEDFRIYNQALYLMLETQSWDWIYRLVFSTEVRKHGGESNLKRLIENIKSILLSTRFISRPVAKAENISTFDDVRPDMILGPYVAYDLAKEKWPMIPPLRWDDASKEILDARLREIGVFPFREYISFFRRGEEFNSLLKRGVTLSRQNLNYWTRRSRSFWKSFWREVGRPPRDTPVVPVQKLSERVFERWNGYIKAGCQSSSPLFGPSLNVVVPRAAAKSTPYEDVDLSLFEGNELVQGFVYRVREQLNRGAIVPDVVEVFEDSTGLYSGALTAIW